MTGPTLLGHETRRARASFRRFVYAATVATAAIAVLAVVLALTLSPDPLIRLGLDELEGATGIRARYGTGRLRLSGIVLTDVDLEVGSRTPSTAPTPTMRMDRVLVRPSFVGLLAGRRGLPCTVVADLSEGSATLTIDRQADAWELTLDWSAIEARYVHPWRGKPDLAGLIDGRLSVSTRVIDGQPAPEGSWNIAGKEVTVDGLKSGDLLVPRLTLSTLHTSGVWTGQRATITKLEAEGSFGHVLLSGKIVLRTPVEKTGLNMRMTLVTSGDIPRELGFLLGMLLPQGSSTLSETYHVGGTLAMPTLSPAVAR